MGKTKRIDAALNAFVVLTVLTVSYTQVLKPYLASKRPRDLGLARGVTLDIERLRPASKTLILALGAHCGYCLASAETYRELAARSAPDLRIVAVFRDRETLAQSFMQDEAINLDHVSGVDFKALRVIGTPTAILTDAHGKVLDYWVGALKLRDKAALEEKVFGKGDVDVP